MTIPITGAFILVVGFSFFFWSSELLYAGMVIAIPFSATAVANVRWGNTDKGVAAWLFLGTLWVLRGAIFGIPAWQKPGWFSSRSARFGLFAFLGAVIASLCVPLLLNGTSWVPDSSFVSDGPIPLQFGLDNLTQTAYLGIGILVAVFAAAENCESPRLFYTLRLYVASSVFAAGWGLLQFWCGITGHAYPAYVFNTSVTESALGFNEVLILGGKGLTRISSVALEPSVLAEELLFAFIVLLICLRLRYPLFGKQCDRAALVVIAATLLATTSTTAYMGIVIALSVAGVVLSRSGKPSKFMFVATAGALAAGALVAAFVPLVSQLVSAVILGKFDIGSGGDRLQSIKLAAQDFLRYPVLGAGWHAVSSLDLVFLILANTGIIGLMAFGFFVLPVLRNLWASAARRKPAAVVLLASVVLLLILSEVAGLTYAAGYDWLVFGLGAGAAVASRKEDAFEATERVGSATRPTGPMPAAEVAR